MKNYNIPVAKVRVVYIKELGPGKQSEIELLKNIPWVKDVISADYRFRIGNDNKNAIYIHNLAARWDPKSTVPVTDVMQYVNKSLNELVQFYLSQADCIFIAGSSYEPSAEHCEGLAGRYTPDIRREQFELAFIKAAKQKGIPLLAVCAGTWRLANAYNVKTLMVPEEKVLHHERWKPVRHPDKVTYLKPGTMLHGIHIAAQKNKEIIFSAGKAQKPLGNRATPNTNFDPSILHVNTTHWRICPTPESQDNTEYQRYFETTAIDVDHGTVEGYESKYGTPTLAVQFHPEYVIPHVRKKDGSTVVVEDYKTHRSILDSLIASGLTFSRKQKVMHELKISAERRKILLPKL